MNPDQPDPWTPPPSGPTLDDSAFGNQPSDFSPPPSQMSLESPRWWTPLAIAGISLCVFMAASLVLSLLAVLIVHGELTLELLRDPDQLMAVSRSRIGLLIMIVLPQFALVVPAVLAATFSKVPTRQRLGLVRGQWPIWAWIASAAATPLVGLVSGIFVGMFLTESENLKEMSSIFRAHGQSGFLIPLALMIGLTPAICEELLFRGYIQTRLTRSFHPAIGILVSSFLFAAFHLDLVHVIAVFPLGVYLGLVSWRSGSLIPAMMGHFVNNFISVILVVMAPEGDADVLALPTIAATLAILGSGIIGMAATIVAALYFGPPTSSASSASASSMPATSSGHHDSSPTLPTGT